MGASQLQDLEGFMNPFQIFSNRICGHRGRVSFLLQPPTYKIRVGQKIRIKKKYYFYSLQRYAYLKKT